MTARGMAMVGILVGGSGETVEYLFRFGVMGTCVSVKKVGGCLVGFHSVLDITGRVIRYL